MRGVNYSYIYNLTVYAHEPNMAEIIFLRNVDLVNWDLPALVGLNND